MRVYGRSRGPVRASAGVQLDNAVGATLLAVALIVALAAAIVWRPWVGVMTLALLLLSALWLRALHRAVTRRHRT